MFVGGTFFGVSVDLLREALLSLPVGPVDRDGVLDVLAGAWDRLDRDDTRMAAFKLNRLEAPHWDGSVLTFAVERHGGRMLGSTRAEVQHWEVDPRAATARVVRSTHRQLSPMSARLDVRPLAAEVAALILAGAHDDRLKWSADGTTVKVQIGRIVPADSARQTVTGRRRRFRAALDDELAGRWAGAAWKYTRPASA